jgi:hypothetical protein
VVEAAWREGLHEFARPTGGDNMASHETDADRELGCTRRVALASTMAAEAAYFD